MPAAFGDMFRNLRRKPTHLEARHSRKRLIYRMARRGPAHTYRPRVFGEMFLNLRGKLGGNPCCLDVRSGRTSWAFPVKR